MPNIITGSEFRNRSNSLGSDKVSFTNHHRSGASSMTSEQRQPDIFTITIRAPLIVGMITHHDPLSMDNIKAQCDMSDFTAIKNTIHEMSEMANCFFKTTESTNFLKNKHDDRNIMLRDMCIYDSLRSAILQVLFSI